MRDVPELPLELEHLWLWYVDLAKARTVGMAANPISYLEIDAFDRRLGLEMTAWEVITLRRLDDVVLSSGRSPRQAQPANEVDARDAGGVKGLLRSLGAKVRRSPGSKKALG